MMKTELSILLIIFTALLLGCVNASSSGEKSGEDDEGKISTQEEIPPMLVVTADKGRLKMHQDGYSIGKDTELTELQKQLEDSSWDVIEIGWIWDSSPTYPDTPMKITYNRLNGELKQIYTENNVIEVYSNISPECLSYFLKSGEKSFYSIENYCLDSKYSFDGGSNIKEVAGEKPKQDEITGSVRVVRDFIKQHANDASSVKFIEWSKVIPAGEHWIVRCKYRGTNALGGVVTENTWFYIQDNVVVDTKSVDL